MGSLLIIPYRMATAEEIQWVSTVIDVIECGLGHMKMHTPPVQLLKNQWNHFIATHGPEEKFLQFSSSGGGLWTLGFVKNPQIRLTI